MRYLSRHHRLHSVHQGKDSSSKMMISPAEHHIVIMVKQAKQEKMSQVDLLNSNISTFTPPPLNLCVYKSVILDLYTNKEFINIFN